MKPLHSEHLKILEKAEILRAQSIVARYSLGTSDGLTTIEKKDGQSHVTLMDGSLKIYVLDDKVLFEHILSDEVPAQILSNFDISHPEAEKLIRSVLQYPIDQVKPLLRKRGIISGEDEIQDENIFNPPEEPLGSDQTRLQITESGLLSRVQSLPYQDTTSRPQENPSGDATGIDAAPITSTSSRRPVREHRVSLSGMPTLVEDEDAVSETDVFTDPPSSSYRSTGQYNRENARTLLRDRVQELAQNAHTENPTVIGATSWRISATSASHQLRTLPAINAAPENVFDLSSIRSEILEVSPGGSSRRVSHGGRSPNVGWLQARPANDESFEKKFVVGYLGEEFVGALCNLRAMFHDLTRVSLL